MASNRTQGGQGNSSAAGGSKPGKGRGSQPDKTAGGGKKKGTERRGGGQGTRARN